MKSIIQQEKECFFCRYYYDVENRKNLHEHHVFEGTGRRKLSEKYGLKVYLCLNHHNLPNGKEAVHFNSTLDLELKKIAQFKFERLHTREEFLENFRRNYLWQEE